MIRKVKGGWRVLSKKSKRNMGTYKTKKAAMNRLRQIEAFKNRKR